MPVTVKQGWRQTDNRFKVAAPDHPLAHFTLFTATEKNTVRHNHRHAPGGFERTDEMLDKHEIRFALGGHPELIAIFEFHAVGGIVLRKGLIGNNNVEPFQLRPFPYSLNSEASMFPRSDSQASSRKFSNHDSESL